MPVNYSNFIQNCSCTVNALPPVPSTSCECTTWSGRLNDLYFIECTEEVNEDNLLNAGWWSVLVQDGKIHRMGMGIGSYAKKNLTTFDKGGCGSASVEQIEWAINYQIFCVEKTEFLSHQFADAMVKGAYKNYNLVARYCDGDEVILPIGKVTLSDFDSALPASPEEFMSFTYEFSWKGLWVPSPLVVAGLNDFVPKA